MSDDEDFDAEGTLERLQDWMTREGYRISAKYWLRCPHCGVFLPGRIFAKTPLGIPCRNCRKLRYSA
jgi:hypothetical protein